MASSSSTASVPIATMRSYCFKERHLYARMVFNLNMDPTRSMEVLAFWLWLEERGHMDVIHNLNIFDDRFLRAIASLGQAFVEALRFDLHPGHPSFRFRQEALSGVGYYLNRVCLKVLEDIKMNVEMEMLARQMSMTSLGSSMNTAHRGPYVPHGEGTSKGANNTHRNNYMPHGEESNRGSMRSAETSSLPSIMDVEREILSGYPFNYMPMIRVPRPNFQQCNNHDSSSNRAFGNEKLQSPQQQQQQQQENIVPKEERTLFVTFSNGYPLTEDELYSFFMGHYGDVESIMLQRSKGNKAPLFAHVSFHSYTTLLQVLNGQDKVKFMLQGKHLWARRFFPRKNKDAMDQ